MYPFQSTLREVPAEAETKSHQLLIRGGYIRPVASGIYHYLPLGLKVVRKIEQLVRRHLDLAGAQEMLMPIMQPIDIWKQSGRDTLYGPELIRIEDRHQRQFVLSPTHEELITTLIKQEVSSYKQLPLTLYQIHTKFRDERRPRYGLLRTREFIMKDAYSFDYHLEGLDASYQTMKQTYIKIFDSLELDYCTVEADGGTISGEGETHEFMAITDIGEDTIVRCACCHYAANIEKAISKPKSRAILNSNFNDEHKEMTKVVTPEVTSINQLMQFLNVDASQILKTIIYNVDQRLVAVVIRGDLEINDLKVKNVLHANSIEIADQAMIEQELGRIVGFIGPKDLTLPVWFDESVLDVKNAIIGANEPDYHLVNVNVKLDLSTTHIADFRVVQEGDTCVRCSNGELVFSKGIELGHIFKLGTKYSEPLQASIINEQGTAVTLQMGCYGIGITRILTAIIEQRYNEAGMVWPNSITPYHVHVIVIKPADELQTQLLDTLIDKFKEMNIDYLIDDRMERAGVKFNDADLIGIPYRIVIGKDSVKGKVEWINRHTSERKVVSTSNAIRELSTELEFLAQVACHVRIE